MFALNIEVSDVHAILSSEMTKIKMADTLVRRLEFWRSSRCRLRTRGLTEWHLIIGKALYIAVNMGEHYVNISSVNIPSIHNNHNKLHSHTTTILSHRFSYKYVSKKNKIQYTISRKEARGFVLPWFINRVFVEYSCSRYYVTITNAIRSVLKSQQKCFFGRLLVKMSPTSLDTNRLSGL